MGSLNSDSDSPFRFRVFARRRPWRFVRIRWNVWIKYDNTDDINPPLASQIYPILSKKICGLNVITSHRLSGPWIIPLFICMPELMLKVARIRCLSGPELNLYKRSNSAKKCGSSSFAIKWTPHTGQEFDGGVPIADSFFIAIEKKNKRKILD